MIRAGIDYSDFLSADEEERLNLLRQFDLNISDFRCYFSDLEIDEIIDTSLTYSEYDYYCGNSYLQKDTDLLDCVEGNEEVRVYKESEEKDTTFNSRYLVNVEKSDYEIYSDLKERYPDIKELIALTLTQYEIPKKEQKAIIQEIKNGDETRRGTLAESYAATVLRKSYFDSEDYQMDFYELWGQYAEFLMEGINNLRTGKNARTPTVYLNNKRMHYILRHMCHNDDVITLPPEIDEIVYKYSELSASYGRYFYSRLLKAINDRQSLWHTHFDNYEDKLLYWLKFDNDDTDSLCDLAEYLIRSFVSYEKLMDDNENKNGVVPDSLRSQSAEDIAVHLAMNSYTYDFVLEMLTYLTESERTILQLRFGLLDGEFRTLDQVGEELYLTSERVRIILTKALRKLKRKFNAQKQKRF